MSRHTEGQPAALPRLPGLAARMVSLGICLMAVAAVAFAWTARLDIVVSAQGRVIPPGRSKVVQPLEPGVIRAIHVQDGQRVRAGDVLVELDGTDANAERDRIQRELWTVQAEQARLQVMLADGLDPAAAQALPALHVADDVPQPIAAQQRALLLTRQAELQTRLALLDADLARRSAERDAIQAGLDQAQASLPLVRQKLAMREDLAATGYVARAALIDARLELVNLERDVAVQRHRLQEAQAGLLAARRQREQALAGHRLAASTELAEATRRIDALRTELLRAAQRSSLRTISSPIDGVVQQLAVSTVGGVVTQAQALMTIVPDGSPLEVQALVHNRDVGHLRAGQRVINKVEAFDFTRYGYIGGQVHWVGTDIINDPQLGPVYPVRILLDEARTPNSVGGSPGVVSAGMSVTAEVRTGQRRMLDYFIAPLLRHTQQAIRER